MSHLPLSIEARKQSLLRIVGQEANPEARQQVDAFWSKYAAVAFVYPWLLDLYVQRDLLMHLIGNSLGLIDWKWDAVQQANSQYLDGLYKLFQSTLDQIALLLKQIRSARTPQIGIITATAPSPPPAGRLDANHPALRGSPYYRRLGGGWWGW